MKLFINKRENCAIGVEIKISQVKIFDKDINMMRILKLIFGNSNTYDTVSIIRYMKLIMI